MTAIAPLPARAVLKISGQDAFKFLQGVITTDLRTVEGQSGGYGALLSPQGKVLVDFLVFAVPAEFDGGYLIDCPAALADTLLTALTRYKMRAQVVIENLSPQVGVYAVWDCATPPQTEGLAFQDTRAPALGWRVIGFVDGEEPLVAGPVAGDQAYQAHRIALGIPEGGKDFTYSDVFPHDINMDQLSGLSFTKGCYIGQEVVSRVEHRGTARTRIITFTYADSAPEEGVDVMVDDRVIGHAGSNANGVCLAKLRLDKLEEAEAAGKSVTAGGIVLTRRGNHPA